MRKCLRLLALLAVALPAVAPAQTMTVYEKDGTLHKFNTDYISEVSFEEVSPDEDGYVFTKLTVDEVYNCSNVVLLLATEDDKVKVALDVYSLSTTAFLDPGVYTVGAADGLHVDTGSYSSVNIDGEAKSLKSGTMTVTKGEAYTIKFDIVLSDDSALKGKYEGAVSGFDGKYSFGANSAKYFENNFPEGLVCVKMSDAASQMELSVYFNTESADRTLPAGTYECASTSAVGTIDIERSFIDLFKPYKSCRFASGTATVGKDGDNYTIDMSLVGVDGEEFTITYSGSIAPADK